ncbi:MAG: Cna B-type domain-containing protein, partial [Ruminiclostridium sp.]|nr:Cna B-type domain-containing protein [Ruminiclostridium sp.]
MTYRKPLGIRVLCVLMSIFMVLVCLNDWSFRSSAAGDPITITIIDDNGVTHTNAEKSAAEGGYGAFVKFDGLKLNGTPITGSETLKDGDKLSFSLDWDSGAFITSSSDGTAEFKFIVDNLKKCKNVEPYFATIEKDTDTSFAIYSYDAANGQMTVTVRPKPNHPQGHYGSCDVNMTVNVNASDLVDGKIDLNPLFNMSFTYAPGELSVTKSTSGSLYQSGGKWYQDFSVSLDVSSGTMKNITVTDTFETGVFVAPANVSLDGTAAAAAVSGNTFTINAGALDAGKHTLTYSLEVDPDAVTESIKNGDAELNNKAKADYNNNVEEKTTPDSPAVVWLPSPSISKSGSFDASTKKITWRITFDPGIIGAFTNGDISTLTVKDTVGKNLSLADLEAGLGSAGISYTESGTDAVIINKNAFLDDGNGKFYVEYTTPAVDDTVIESTDPNVENSAEGTYKDITLPKHTAKVDVTDTTGTVGSTTKRIVSSNPENLTIKWSVDVEIPAEGVIDSIKVIDGPGGAEFRSDLNMNVQNCTVLKGGIETFRYYINGTETSYASLNAGSVAYKEIPRDNIYGPVTSGTFESGKSAGFEFTLGSDFIESNRGKTLTVEYESRMDGERYQSAVSDPLTEDKYALIKYKNHVDVEYYKGSIKYPNSPAGEAEYVPDIVVDAKKFTYSGKGIFDNYGNAGGQPVLAFWEVRFGSKTQLVAGDTVVVRDTVSAGNKYYPGSVILFGDDLSIDNTWSGDLEGYHKRFDSQISVAGDSNEIVFTVNVDDAIAAYSEGSKRLRIIYATTPTDEAVSKAINFGDVEKEVSNNADVYLNNNLQVKNLKASQKLKPSGEICGKTQAVTACSPSDSSGRVSYTLNINQPAAKLSSDGKIIADDWLGGNLDIVEGANAITITKQRYDETSPTVIHYDVIRNPAYDKSEGSVRDYFYLNGTQVADSMIYKTGVGTKIRFVLDDQTAYTITYDCKYDKIKADLDSVEEAARFSNTVVIHNSTKDSLSKTVQISYSEYHSNADVHAAADQKNIIFDIKKDWKNDTKAERPEKITLHVLKTNLSTGETESYDKDIILHDNAAVQEDGSWLFSLKLLGYEKIGTNEVYYSYSIDENQIEGYATSWSTSFDDIQIPDNFKDANYVVSSILTNTTAPKFIISKMDITKEHELSGASLAIYKASDVDANNKPIDGKTPVKSWTSDGTEKTISLANGDYVLIETGYDFTDTTTGKTYKVTESAVKFTIDDTGVKSVTGNKTGTVTDDDKENGFITYTAAGTVPAKFVVHDAERVEVKAELKVDKKSITDESEITGAKLAIYKAEDIDTNGKPKDTAVAVDEWKSNTTTHTSSLSDGDYILIETGDTFTETVTGKKYFVTDSSFSFTVNNGEITNATPVNPAGGSGKIEYNSTTNTVKVCDAEV